MTNSLSVSSSMLLSLAMFLRIFMGHFLRNGETITCEVTDRRKLLPSTSSLRSLYYFTSLFIKGMHLTHDG